MRVDKTKLFPAAIKPHLTFLLYLARTQHLLDSHPDSSNKKPSKASIHHVWIVWQVF